MVRLRFPVSALRPWRGLAWPTALLVALLAGGGVRTVVAQSAGGACAGNIVASPDANGNTLKCSGGQWLVVATSASRSTSGTAERMCSGDTGSGANWVGQSVTTDTKYLDIDLTSCAFTNTPKIFANLQGSGANMAVGTDSIFNASATGFRVYISNKPWVVSLGYSGMHSGWNVQWLAVGN